MADRISIIHRDGAPRQIFDIDRLHSKAAQFALETLHVPIESNDALE